MRRNPLVLAFTARHLLTGAVEGARTGYRATRRELSGAVPLAAITAALKEHTTEGQRLSAELRSVELVERALWGS